jgi:outer membrane protein
MRILRTLILMIAGLAAVSVAQTKFGYVNSAKVLQEYPEAQAAQDKITNQGKKWQGQFEQMSKDLQAKYDAFQKKEATLSEAAKRDQREELVTLEQKGVQFRQEKFGNDGELAVLTDSLLTPIKKKVMRVIEQVAKEKGIQFMFDRNDQILVLLYGDPKFDYTNLIIDRLKRGGDEK